MTVCVEMWKSQKKEKSMAPEPEPEPEPEPKGALFSHLPYLSVIGAVILVLVLEALGCPNLSAILTQCALLLTLLLLIMAFRFHAAFPSHSRYRAWSRAQDPTRDYSRRRAGRSTPLPTA